MSEPSEMFKRLLTIDAERREKHAAVLDELGDDGWILCWQSALPEEAYVEAFKDGIVGFNAATDCWVALRTGVYEDEAA